MTRSGWSYRAVSISRFRSVRPNDSHHRSFSVAFASEFAPWLSSFSVAPVAGLSKSGRGGRSVGSWAHAERINARQGNKRLMLLVFIM